MGGGGRREVELGRGRRSRQEAGEGVQRRREGRVVTREYEEEREAHVNREGRMEGRDVAYAGPKATKRPPNMEAPRSRAPSCAIACASRVPAAATREKCA